MNNKVNFSIEDMTRFEDDEDSELAVAHVNFLSTRKNAHNINITEKILRRDAGTILGKFLIAKMDFLENDVMGHEDNQIIMGYFPKEQEIKFEDKDGYIVASADAVVSKLYATKYYDLFLKDNYRNTSVEMLAANQVELPDGSFDIDGFNLTGVTTLGKKLNGSCPDANMSIIQFSEDKANRFYHEQHSAVNSLKQYVSERRVKMAEKSYKVNKSKDVLSETAWGDVNKSSLRDKIMKASNRANLVKDVYMLVESGWEDAPIEHLKYPVMQFKGDTLVYNRYGLASALAYAKKENESSVVKKVMSIYKKLDLEDDDSEKKEETEKMSQEKFAINLDKMWGAIYGKLEERYPDKDYGSIYRIQGLYEESNKKFVVIYRKDEETLYKLYFDYTEDGLTMDEEMTEVELEFVDKENTVKFECPNGHENETKFDEEEEESKDDEDSEDDEDAEKEDKEKMSADMNVDAAAYAEMLNKEAERNKELASQLEEKENIIMGYRKEIEELRKFKEDVEEEKKMSLVNETLARVKGKMEDKDYSALEKSGMECKFSEITAWKNNVFATVGASVLKMSAPKSESFIRMEIPKETEKSLWDRL